MDIIKTHSTKIIVLILVVASFLAFVSMNQEQSELSSSVLRGEVLQGSMFEKGKEAFGVE